jgi:xanthine dehydrogenase YagR molybdenum-binding subunit
MQTIMTTVARYLPDREGDRLLDGPGYVGQPVDRADGSVKARGAAKFAAEYSLEDMAHAAVVCSTISKGKILSMEIDEAERLPGVIAIITHHNTPRLQDPPMFNAGGASAGAAGSDHPILQGPEIFYNGQVVAVVVAETQDQAEHAASIIEVHYQQEEARLDFEGSLSQARPPQDVQGEPAEVKIGDAEKALGESAFFVDNLYRTPRYNHNAIEPHASIAFWSEDGESLVCFEASQMVHGFKNTHAKVFGIEPGKVRVLSPFVGGAFGSKSMWSNSLLCALAARISKRPVKLALSREQVFRLVGGRTPSIQRVALGADARGKLTALVHTGTTSMTEHNNFPEQFTFPARHLYDVETMWLSQEIVLLDTVANTFMRAPGESIGGYALESALDELSYQLGMDPIELRRRNEPEYDPTKGTGFSQRDLLLAYQRGAEAFGWQRREPRSQRDGGYLIGQGVATAYYPYYRMAAAVRLRINADGSAVVSTSAHEMGMGTATVQIQHAAQRLGLPRDMVSFEYGDSDLPETPIAGGSNQTASLVAGISAAIEKAQRALLDMTTPDSPLAIAKLEEVEARHQGLYLLGDAVRGESYAEILARAGESHLEIEASAPPALELVKHSMHSYGAQFVELRVKESTGEVRLTRLLGSFDFGRVLNAKTAQSQLRGGIIMGIGMALTEESLFDKRYGRVLNASMSEYHLPVNLDVPAIEILTNDIPDPYSPLGVRGIGELGITGVAAAIANAIHNATGKRIRDLPITLDKLLG